MSLQDKINLITEYYSDLDPKCKVVLKDISSV